MEIIKSKIPIRQIFLSNQAWLCFWATNILLLRWAIIWNVAKMLLCRNGWGYYKYSCPKCSYSKHVPHTCKSRFCSSCGKVAVDRWVETSLSEILNVSYKHLVFTIPEQFRDWIRNNRKAGLNALFLAVKNSLLKYCSQRGYRPGIIMVLHTFGADLKWNVHIHVIITDGGLSLNSDRWINNRYIPQHILRPLYRYALLQEFKKLFKQGKLKPPPAYKLIRSYETFNSWLTQFYKTEWYVYIGKTLKDANFTVHYIGRYGKRPVIAESRIEAFDGSCVTFSYKDRATGEETSLTLPVAEFIGRLVQHIPDEYFHTIRHAGIFANPVRSKLLETARNLLNQKPLPKPKSLNWRTRYQKTFKKDPLVCPHCNTIMTLTQINVVRTQHVRKRVKKKHNELLSQYHNTSQ